MSSLPGAMECPSCPPFPESLEAVVGWGHFHTPAPCWELLWRVYRRQLGITLPLVNVMAPKDRWAELIEAGKIHWIRTDAPSRYNAVLMRGRFGDHIGVAADRETVVHVLRPIAGASLNRLDALCRQGWALSYYRYGGQTS